MQTDKGGQQGPRSTRDPPFGNSGGSRYRQAEGRPINSEQSHNAAPPGPPFGFQQMPNMPNIPNLPNMVNSSNMPNGSNVPPSPADFAAMFPAIFGSGAPPGPVQGQPPPPGA